MNIYSHLYQPGMVHIKLHKIGANIRGIPMVLFFGPDKSGGTPNSCGGDEKLLSFPKSKFFSHCNNTLK